jgi:hypothetical protein
MVLYGAAPAALRGPGIAQVNVKIHTVGYQRVFVGLDTKKSTIIGTVAFICTPVVLADNLPSRLNFYCGGPALAGPRNDRGWKPLPQKQDLLDGKVVQRTITR